MTVKRFNWILKICIKFQVLTFLFAGVDYLLDERLAKNAQRENVSTSIYVQFDNMY